MFHTITALVLAAVVVCGCCKNPRENKKRLVLLYIAATEASLSPYAENNVTDMLQGYVPKKNSKTEELLVLFQNRDNSTATGRSDAVLSRYYKNNSGNIIKEDITNYGNEFNACDPATLARVLAEAEAISKPAYRSMLISSHGTGCLPIGYFDSSGEKSGAKRLSSDADGISDLSRLKIRESVGYDSYTKNEIDIRDFAAAVSKYHWESILFDCCYMSTVEVAYEVRGCCDYVVGSPTEILITGFPYTVILEQLFKSPGKEGLEYICQKYYDLYQGQSGSLQSGTIALTDCSQLDALATICANIIATRRPEMEAVARLNVQHYFYSAKKDYFFDLAHYFEQFATAEQFAQFSAQMDKAVPYKAATEKFIGLKIDHYSGLSVYIPHPSYPILNAYYRQLAWNQAVKIVE